MSKLWLWLIASAVVGIDCLETIYEWKYIDYLWDSYEQKQSFMTNGSYNHEAIIPIDVDKARDGRVFITLVKNEGVPATLGTVSNLNGPSGPLVSPYPNWSWHNRNDCQGITNVYRVTINDCNKMYVLDTGYLGLKQICPAQVLLFDLGTDTLLSRLTIPYNISHGSNNLGLLVTPVVEYSGPDCKLDNLFIADSDGYGLIVWNSRKFTRLEGQIYKPQAAETKVTIAGENFTLADSLLGLALSKRNYENEARELYYRPFASRALYATDTRLLANGRFADQVQYNENREFLPYQASMMAISQEGTLFFGLAAGTAVSCWNRYRDMTVDNHQIVAFDLKRLQFVSGMKLLPPSRTKGQKEELWMLSNRYQKIVRKSMDFSEINFRILMSPVSDLIQGTKCEPPKRALISRSDIPEEDTGNSLMKYLNKMASNLSFNFQFNF